MLLSTATCIDFPGKCNDDKDCKNGVCRQELCYTRQPNEDNNGSECVPETVDEHCESVGKACGINSWTDNCGQTRNEICGECPNCTKFDEERNRPALTNWTNWPAIPIPPPNDAYSVINDQGDVLDSQTCLIWQRYVQTNTIAQPHTGGPQFFTWYEAKDHCKGNWRLPSKVELESIIDNSRINLAINDVFGQPENGCPSRGCWFWTATDYEHIPGSGYTDPAAWYVDFSSGYSNGDNKDYTGFVRCVR